MKETIKKAIFAETLGEFKKDKSLSAAIFLLFLAEPFFESLSFLLFIPFLNSLYGVPSSSDWEKYIVESVQGLTADSGQQTQIIVFGAVILTAVSSGMAFDVSVAWYWRFLFYVCAFDLIGRGHGNFVLHSPA